MYVNIEVSFSFFSTSPFQKCTGPKTRELQLPMTNSNIHLQQEKETTGNIQQFVTFALIGFFNYF